MKLIVLIMRRWFYTPFESLIGGLAVITAIIGLTDLGTLGTDVLYTVLPDWVATVFLLSYLLSGVCLLLGLGFLRADIESAGLVIIASSQIARTVATANLLGFTNATISLAFAILVTGACWARIAALLNAQKTRGYHGG